MTANPQAPHPLPDMGRQTKKVSFDPTINLGHVLTMAGLGVTAIAGYMSLTTRIDYVEKQLATMASMFERSIRADTRLDAIELRINRIEERDEK